MDCACLAKDDRRLPFIMEMVCLVPVWTTPIDLKMCSCMAAAFIASALSSVFLFIYMEIPSEDPDELSSDPEETHVARHIPATRTKDMKNPLVARLYATAESPMALAHFLPGFDAERPTLEARLRALKEEYAGLKPIKRCLRETDAL